MIALVTADVAQSLDPDLVPLRDEIAARDVGVRIVSWDDDTVDWASFDVVVIRSTWDYTERLDEFLAWVRLVDAVTTLINPASVVEWSTDKRYLAELADAGIATIPTEFVAPGGTWSGLTGELPSGVHVVKPTVGAGSSGARRCEPDEIAAHIELLHADGRTAMVQPYLELLDEHGETALCLVADGSGSLVLSHAFRKGAILTSVDVEQEGDLFAKEDIGSRSPAAGEQTIADAVFNTEVVRSLGDVTFARVDVAPWREPDGSMSYVLLELELVEPSFYFVESDPTDSGGGAEAIGRFADAVLAVAAASGDSSGS